VLIAGGAAITRPFTFTATGNCGGIITPILDFWSGTNRIGPVTFNLPLGRPVLALSENFDGLTIPAGWSASLSGEGTPWTVSTAQYDTPPRALFAPDVADISDNRILSQSMSMTSTNARLTFRHRFNLESSVASGTGFDGGVLEISIDGAAFVDVLDAGGSFAAGDYNTTISTRYRNPLGGRAAWSGDSQGFVSSTLNFPGSIAGHSIRLSWRLGCDRNTGAGGWYVDSVSVSDGAICCRPLIAPTIFNTRKAGSNMTFSYGSVSGQSYIVESKFNLDSFPWVPRRTNAGDGSVQSYTNTTSGGPLHFFRLRTQ